VWLVGYPQSCARDPIAGSLKNWMSPALFVTSAATGWIRACLKNADAVFHTGLQSGLRLGPLVVLRCQHHPPDGSRLRCHGRRRLSPSGPLQQCRRLWVPTA